MTEVMPATPPHTSLRMLLRSWPGLSSKNCANLVSAHDLQRNRGFCTYAFVEVITAKLHGGVGDNADAVGSVSTHETPPSLLFPHLPKSLAHAHFVLVASLALDLEQDLESLQGGDHGAGDGASHSTGHERGHHRLRDGQSNIGEG